MSQIYKIISVKKGNTWESSYGEMQSYALALEGVGEPVQLNKKTPVKQEPQVGDELTGTLEEQERNGRTFYKFKVDMSANKPGFKGQPRDDKAIQAQWSLGKSVDLAIALGKPDDMEMIKSIAKDLFKAIEEIKTS